MRGNTGRKPRLDKFIWIHFQQENTTRQAPSSWFRSEGAIHPGLCWPPLIQSETQSQSRSPPSTT